jgi:hypothetical protein
MPFCKAAGKIADQAIIISTFREATSENIIVAIQQVYMEGQSKLLKRCTLPLTFAFFLLLSNAENFFEQQNVTYKKNSGTFDTNVWITGHALIAVNRGS